MKLEEVLAKGIKNGRFFAIEAETEKKRGGIVYRKRTKLVAQFGCNYENLAAVKEQGEREPRHVSWFEHTQYRSIVRSKKDPAKLYLQIMNPAKFRTEYYLADGTPKTKAELIAMGAIKDEPSEKPLTLVYALESIKKINYKEEAAA